MIIILKNNISGFKNEFEIADYLDSKKVSELNPLYYDMIHKLYNDKITDTSYISSYIDYNKKKYDLVIKINGIKKLISIKMGSRNSVHVEGISSFIHFLIESGVKREAVIEYLKYHYADGTTNGTGLKRISSDEYKMLNQEKINLINSEINNSYILKKAINRFVLQGKNSGIKIDGLLYGTEFDFFFLTRDDVYNIIMSKINLYSTGVHFGPLFCQPLARCLNYNPKYERGRFCVQIKWYSLFDDIIEYKIIISNKC